jgi:hypothetical protein
MRMRPLIGLMAAAALAVPATASAALFTITIDGVDTSAAAIAQLELDIAAAPGAARPILPGMFVGLGNCNPVAGFGNSCDGSAPVSNNPFTSAADVAANNALNGTNFSNGAIYGHGLPVDQMIFHRMQSSFDVTGGVFTPPVAPLEQTFDFVVGSTGGGSAGPFVAPFSFDYNLNFTRNVRITGTDSLGGVIDVTQSVTQLARLSVGWFEDTLLVFESDPVTFNLGADGSIQVRLMAEGPITAGDPEIVVGITAVPLPSTLALLGLGFIALARARRNAIA